MKSKRKNRFAVKSTGIALIVTASVFLCFSFASAMPLNLQLNPYPDILSSFISVGYDASTDTLTANGFAQTLDDDGIGIETILAGNFDLSATIDDTGTFSAGNLFISGIVPTLGFNSGTLLTGTLNNFGFAAVDTLEFLFTVTGGDAAGLFGSSAGVMLTQTGFTGDFTSNWASLPAGGLSDTAAPVPEPTTLVLLCSGLLPFYNRFRNKNLNS